MLTYSTCTDCGGLLQVTDYAQTTHPGCTPRLTKLDRLLDDYRAAAEMGDQPDLEAELLAEIEALETAPPRPGEAALIYAAWGWPVFPLLPLADAARIAARTGDTVTRVAKRPATRHGFKDATTDPARIAAWWERHPDSNIGLATGHRFDVVDVDTHKGGRESYARLQEDDFLPPVHGRVSTASGGYHLYIEPTGDGNSHGTTKSALPGIDFRGVGGYVVAPPSWLGEHVRRWSWISKPSPEIRA